MKKQKVTFITEGLHKRRLPSVTFCYEESLVQSFKHLAKNRQDLFMVVCDQKNVGTTGLQDCL